MFLGEKNCLILNFFFFYTNVSEIESRAFAVRSIFCFRWTVYSLNRQQILLSDFITVWTQIFRCLARFLLGHVMRITFDEIRQNVMLAGDTTVVCRRNDTIRQYCCTVRGCNRSQSIPQPCVCGSTPITHYCNLRRRRDFIWIEWNVFRFLCTRITVRPVYRRWPK